LNASHRFIPKILLLGDAYEKETVDCIVENRGGGVVVHAGAFIGDMLPRLSEDNHRVYAFEPGNEFFRCAQITLALNFDNHRTTLINKGLGETDGEVVQLLTKEDEGGTSEGGASRIMAHPDGVEPYRMETIKLTTIDSTVLNEAISLIHLDIEGYEENALKGAINHIRATYPVLIIEVGSDERLETEFYQKVIFGELGYAEVDRMHGNIVLKSPHQVKL